MLAIHADPAMTQFHQTPIFLPHSLISPSLSRTTKTKNLHCLVYVRAGVIRRHDTRQPFRRVRSHIQCFVGVSYANRLGASCTFVVACGNPMMFKSKHSPVLLRRASSRFVSLRLYLSSHTRPPARNPGPTGSPPSPGLSSVPPPMTGLATTRCCRRPRAWGG